MRRTTLLTLAGLLTGCMPDRLVYTAARSGDHYTVAQMPSSQLMKQFELNKAPIDKLTEQRKAILDEINTLPLPPTSLENCKKGIELCAKAREIKKQIFAELHDFDQASEKAMLLNAVSQ